MNSTNFLKNIPAQLYLSLIPAGACIYLSTHGFRNNPPITNLYVTQSKVPVPDSFVETIDNEFTELATQKKKKFRNINFGLSLIDNLEARTYGSLYLSTGAEFQIPVISTIKNASDLKTTFPNLLDLLKELKLPGTVETANLSEADLQKILLTERARHFVLRREIIIAESFSHIAIPIAVGGLSISLGYPMFKALFPHLGGYPALLVVGAAALYWTYHVIKLEIRMRVLATDRRIVEEDNSMIQGALEYFNARLAFGKLLHNLGGRYEKLFDANGNCLKQYVKYTDRIQQIKEFADLKKPKVNIRAL